MSHLISIYAVQIQLFSSLVVKELIKVSWQSDLLLDWARDPRKVYLMRPEIM